MVLSVTEKTFKQEVLQSPTPVLVHFWAPWCGLCKVMNPQLMQFQAKWGGKVKLVGVNADSNFKLANAYRLTSLPTLILFQDGQMLDRLEDFRGRDEIREALDAISLNCPTSRAIAREYQTNSV